MSLLRNENIDIGKAVQLYECSSRNKQNCIVTYADEKELVLMYYDKEIEELIYKTLTKEDLIFNDYKLKLLS